MEAKGREGRNNGGSADRRCRCVSCPRRSGQRKRKRKRKRKQSSVDSPRIPGRRLLARQLRKRLSSRPEREREGLRGPRERKWQRGPLRSNVHDDDNYDDSDRDHDNERDDDNDAWHNHVYDNSDRHNPVDDDHESRHPGHSATASRERRIAVRRAQRIGTDLGATCHTA
jgi:hypothetical protein